MGILSEVICLVDIAFLSNVHIVFSRREEAGGQDVGCFPCDYLPIHFLPCLLPVISLVFTVHQSSEGLLERWAF